MSSLHIGGDIDRARQNQGFTQIKLIGTLTSPFVRKIRVILDIKSIQYDMSIDAPSQPGSQVDRFNPLGKIPVLVVDDGEAIYDSTVIAEYLDLSVPTPSLLPAPGPLRISVKIWESLGNGLLDAAVAIILETRRDPSEQSVSWKEKQAGRIEHSLAAMSAKLGDRQYCVSDAMTLADITMGVALGYLDFRFPRKYWRAAHPNLAAFYTRIANLPSFSRTNPPFDQGRAN